MVKVSVKYILFLIIISTPVSSKAESPFRYSVFDFCDTFQSDTTLPDSVIDVVKITRKWELPANLKNISAIDYISLEKMACLQEEVGSIFIFNLESGEIEQEIAFGPPGDYEGLALVGNVAYIACADGRIIEVSAYNSEHPEIKEIGTHLTVKENVTGLCYDKKNKQLLVSVKGAEDPSEFYKGVYSFNLVTKSMPVKPAIKIDLRNRVFSKLQPKNVQTVFQPSDLDVNPLNGQLYLIDGNRSQLLRMRFSESIRTLLELNKEKFIQPEGITFTPSGELFIASKGMKDENAMLFKVRLK